MRPPKLTVTKADLNTVLGAVATSAMVVVDHYPTLNGQWESQVRTVENNNFALQQDSNGLDSLDFTHRHMPWSGGVQFANAPRWPVSPAQPSPVLAFIEYPHQATRAPQVVTLPQQWPIVDPSNHQGVLRGGLPDGQNMVGNCVLNQQAAFNNQMAGASTVAQPVQSAPVTAINQPFAKKTCDVDIELRRIVKANVTVAYNIAYEGADSPRPDEEVVNVSFSDADNVDGAIPADLAKMIGQNAPAIGVAAR